MTRLRLPSLALALCLLLGIHASAGELRDLFVDEIGARTADGPIPGGGTEHPYLSSESAARCEEGQAGHCAGAAAMLEQMGAVDAARRFQERACDLGADWVCLEIDRTPRRPEDPPPQYLMLEAREQAQVAAQHGDVSRAQTLFQQAVEHARALPEVGESSITLRYAADFETGRHRYDRAIALLEESISLQRSWLEATGQEARHDNSDLARIRTRIAANHYLAGRHGAAEEQLELARRHFENAMAGWKESGAPDPLQLRLAAETYSWLVRTRVARGDARGALLIAENARSRLLFHRMGGDPRQQLELSDLRATARETDAHLVFYALGYAFELGRNFAMDALNDAPVDEITTWVISPQGEIAHRRVSLGPEHPDLVEMIGSARSGLGVRGRGMAIVPTSQAEAASPLSALHRVLIEPVEDLLPDEPGRLVVLVPEGPLLLVPFAALRAPGGQSVVERHEIAVAPSVSALSQARRNQERLGPEPRRVVVVGNPDMPTLPDLRGTAPPAPLPPLPGALAEARRVASLYEATALTGGAATAQEVVRRSPKARLIHLATHGLLDEEGANLGALALAPGGGSSGFLTGRELRALDLSAELVVLSACDTGNGRISGDGVTSLSQSFLEAGVPSVVASLWAVDDESTVQLMSSFHAALRSGARKSAALRSAMLETRQSHPHPREWSAFVLLGAPEASESLRRVAGDATGVQSLRQAFRSGRRPLPIPPDAEDRSAVLDETRIQVLSQLGAEQVGRFYRQSLEQAGFRELRSESIGEQIDQLVYYDDVDVVSVSITNLGERGTSIYAEYETDDSDREALLAQAREREARGGD